MQNVMFLLLCLCLATGCAKQSTESIIPKKHIAGTDSSTGIGPYVKFSGRLLVIKKEKRWQVMLNWHAKTPEKGWLRLHHAASSIIIEVTWQDRLLRTLDNRARPPVWKTTGYHYLQQQGINISPEDLSTFLLGHLPKGFSEKKKNEWHGYRGKSRLRVVWNPNRKSLMIMDMYQGSKIVLYILG